MLQKIIVNLKFLLKLIFIKPKLKEKQGGTLAKPPCFFHTLSSFFSFFLMSIWGQTVIKQNAKFMKSF